MVTTRILLVIKGDELVARARCEALGIKAEGFRPMSRWGETRAEADSPDVETLNRWYCEAGQRVEGQGFRDGSLLYWGPMGAREVAA